jgi:hypothetical protein
MVAKAFPPSVRDPVEPVPACSSDTPPASAIVTGPALDIFISVITVPIGNATEELAGIVHVRAVVVVL